MLGFVQRTYEPVLGPDHHAFIARFEGLSRRLRSTAAPGNSSLSTARGRSSSCSISTSARPR
ncbi:hypothetical protein [Bradyrhizobium canariense]|uniref:hypothetical protein n=1 Tax=Bradyrhizobium canariense TaxID=255045 RepID=UPI0030833215